MKKAIAIVQSSYIPWKGYFDLINLVDEFILFDDVQYTVRDWRNRNLIKTGQGSNWLTVPVNSKGLRSQLIREATVVDPHWRMQHWQTLQHQYARAPHFNQYKVWLRNLYEAATYSHLSDINRHFIEAVCAQLGVTTTLSWSMDYRVVDGKSERILELCRQAGADLYVSGPSARAYMDYDLFEQHGIEVRFMDYSGYPEYSQLFPPFSHNVSVLDLLLNEGPESASFLKTGHVAGKPVSADGRYELIQLTTEPALVLT